MVESSPLPSAPIFETSFGKSESIFSVPFLINIEFHFSKKFKKLLFIE